MERSSLFSRDLLSLIGKGEDAPAPAPEQRRDEMEEDELNLALALSLGSGIHRTQGDKLPRSSSSAAALTTLAEVPAPPAIPRTGSVPVQAEEHGPRLLTTPAEVPAPPALPRAGSVPVQAEEHAPRLPTTPAEVPAPPTLPRASSVPVQAEEHTPRLPASESPSSASLEVAGTLMSLKRLELKRKMIDRMTIERRNTTSCTSKEAAAGQVPQMNAQTGRPVSSAEAVVGNNENHSSSGMDLAKRCRGRPPNPKYTLTSQHSLQGPWPLDQFRQKTSQHSLSAAGKKPNSASKGTTVTTEPSSSSSVPSFFIQAIKRQVMAASPLLPSSLAPRRAAAATLAIGSSSSSRGDRTIFGRAAATRPNNTWDDVGRRLLQAMPAVHTKDLRSGNRVNGFLYKYQKADDVKIVCVCHGRFFTPSEFVQHAGADNGEIENPLRHIVVSPRPNL